MARTHFHFKLKLLSYLSLTCIPADMSTTMHGGFQHRTDSLFTQKITPAESDKHGRTNLHLNANADNTLDQSRTRHLTVCKVNRGQPHNKFNSVKAKFVTIPPPPISRVLTTRHAITNSQERRNVKQK